MKKFTFLFLFMFFFKFYCIGLTLNANPTSNNGSGGVFMTLTTNVNGVNLTSFNTMYSSVSGTSVTVEIYSRSGPYAGFTGSNVGWTLLGTLTTTSAGTTVLAPLDVTSLNIQLAPSTTTSFYLHSITAGGGIRYYGTGTNSNTSFSDANLALFTDVTRTGTVAFGGTQFSPRAYTGTIDYELSGPPSPCTSITGITCGTSVTAATNEVGLWSPGSCGFATPGQEKIYSFTPAVSGTYVLQITASSGEYGDYFWKAAADGCSETGWTCIGDASGAESNIFGPLTAGTLYYILFDSEVTTSESQTFQINCLSPDDPCANVMALSCGSSVTVATSGEGFWSPVSCGFSTPGQEKVYSFTANATGMHTLNITAASGGFGDYFYKTASVGCSSTGWTCIGDASVPETNSFGPLTAGTTYYILFDSEVTSPASQTFQLDCPCGASIAVSENSGIPNNGTICDGASVILTASGGGTYSWSTGATTAAILVSPGITKTYTVTVSVGETCTATASSTVTVAPLPTATAAATPNPICVGKTLSLTSSGGTSYAWSGPAGYSSSLQNPSIANIQLTQDGIYTVTVTNAGGCTATATADVTVVAQPNATATVSPNPVCAGELATFTASGGVAYKWSGPNGFNSDNKQFGLHMAPNMAGTYYVTVTNSAGCSKTASVSVTVNAAPNVIASVSPNPACSGQTVQFTASGGTTYQWTGPAGFSSTLQNPSINNAQQYNSGEYTVVVTNGSGCKSTVVLGLKVYQTPAGQISYDTKSTCTGGTLQLYASGGSSYQWIGPAGFSSSLQNPTRPNANSTFSGVYTVVISNTYGCSVTLSVSVTIRPLPVITAWTTTPEVCEGSTAYLYSNGGTSYSWSGPYGYGSTFQNPIITNMPTYMTGIYTVTGANEYGCTAKANVFITVQSVNAIINATPNPVPNGGTLYLTASGGTSYQWTGPDGFHTTQQNPIVYKFTQPNEGLYSCIVSSSAGCQDTKIILVKLKVNGLVGQDYTTEQIEGNYVQVFPNPASTSIKLNDESKGISDYQILNGQGQIVMSGKSSAGEQIQISTLAPGAYYIHWIYQNDNDNKVSNISRFVKTN